MGGGVPRVVVGWMGAPTVGGGREQAESQEVLLALRLWHPHTLPGGLPGVALHPNFRQNLRVALLGGVSDGGTHTQGVMGGQRGKRGGER